VRKGLVPCEIDLSTSFLILIDRTSLKQLRYKPYHGNDREFVVVVYLLNTVI
jgi:hypothetical protein